MQVRLLTDTPPVIRNKAVLIAGDGKTLPADVMTAGMSGASFDVCSIGRSYKLFPVIDHWMNVDCAEAFHWAENLPVQWASGKQRHTLGVERGFDFGWDIPQSDYGMEDVMWHGSTALFAVYVCLAMGYGRIVLAGCPLDAGGHWYHPDSTGPRWTGESYQAWLDFADTEDARKVKSLSGYTRIILGEPTQEWESSQQK